VILSPHHAGIATAASMLRRGGLVALPTETVYGLAARADSEEAVGRIFQAKGRPSFNPLIVHVADLRQAQDLAKIDERAELLAEAFWPGALTMVLPLRPDARLASAVTAGLPTIAIRCPAHPVMQSVLAATRLALAAPSANRSGAVSPTSAAHVALSLGSRLDCIVDGGACEQGIESTIVALRDDGAWQILRPGLISASRIEAVLGPHAVNQGPVNTIEAPGQLERHYAPGKPMRLNAGKAEAGEFHIGFAGIVGDATLSKTGDLGEAAAKLYELLHLAAASDKECIAVAPVPDSGIGCAINDRLRRAAA